MRIEEIRSGLVARLRARREEIEAATLTRVYGIAEPLESSDPEYAHGLKAAVSAALDYGFNALERSEERAPPVPAVLLTQARLAARSGVSLDTVLRRYLAGYTLLGDFVIEEVEKGGLRKGSALQRLLRAQAALFDRLLAAVSEEYGREECGRLDSTEQRRAKRVKRLLAGELVDVSELGYELQGWHLGLLATGTRSGKAIDAFTQLFNCQVLKVCSEESTVWAWLGSRSPFDQEELGSLATRGLPRGLSLAIGEPAEGIAGWRLTHCQARAALSIALRCESGVVRYRQVALLVSMLGDDLLATSLRQLYLAPLEAERDGGAGARETLWAYFRAERNISSTAAALGVNRNTVASRLRAIERRLGAPLGACATELEAALRIELVERRSAPPDLTVRPA